MAGFDVRTDVCITMTLKSLLPTTSSSLLLLSFSRELAAMVRLNMIENLYVQVREVIT